MRKMILILSIFFLITGCNEEEAKQQGNSIYGKWSLIKYEPGFSPTENFSVNQISWSFEQTNVLKIQVDNTISTSPIKSEGQYDFSLNDNRITIDNVEYDFSINENTLIISDDPSSDGFKATFLKATE